MPQQSITCSFFLCFSLNKEVSDAMQNLHNQSKPSVTVHHTHRQHSQPFKDVGTIRNWHSHMSSLSHWHNTQPVNITDTWPNTFTDKTNQKSPTQNQQLTSWCHGHISQARSHEPISQSIRFNNTTTDSWSNSPPSFTTKPIHIP